MIGVEGYLPIKYGSVFKACPGYDLLVGAIHIPVLCEFMYIYMPVQGMGYAYMCVYLCVYDCTCPSSVVESCDVYYTYNTHHTLLLQVLSPEGTQCPPNTQGALAIKLPLPPGCMTTLYNNDERFLKAYFERLPGYYDTGKYVYYMIYSIFT